MYPKCGFWKGWITFSQSVRNLVEILTIILSQFSFLCWAEKQTADIGVVGGAA